MRELYIRSGRTNGLMSGLWQQFKAELLEDFAQRMAEQQRDAWCANQRREGGH